MNTDHFTGRRLRQLAMAVLTPLLMTMVHSCSPTREPGQVLHRRTLLEDSAPEVIRTFPTGFERPVEIVFHRGRAHNHPLMAIWLEDMDGNYLQTLYVAESIGKGYFRHGDPSSGRWMPGPVRRPAALPYWGHQRGIQAPDGYYLPTREDPVPDALTGPTPSGSFVLASSLPPGDGTPVRILLEINQSWDWNRHWTNNKFPEDPHYKSSSQPALVYEAVIQPGDSPREVPMQPIGHSHWSGASGELFPGLETLTTALEIAREIVVRVPGP